MDFTRREIETGAKVQSLCWLGDSLIDVAGGLNTYSLDGSSKRGGYTSFGRSFDAAIVSPSQRYAAIYQRLGTKGVVIDLTGQRRGPAIREIDRSYYHADAYEYPIAFILDASGRELLAHCPKEYNALHFEEIERGKCLTRRRSESADFFHSRLQQSPGGRWLLSAGWIWQPTDWIGLYDIERALTDPCELNTLHDGSEWCSEISSATFIDHRHLLVCGGDGEELNPPEPGVSDVRWAVERGHVAVFDLETNRRLSHVQFPRPLGELLAFDDFVIGFYEHPRLYRISTGEQITEWPDLPTGEQKSSIIWHVAEKQLPPVAKDAANKRFAVAVGQRIVAIHLS